MLLGDIYTKSIQYSAANVTAILCCLVTLIYLVFFLNKRPKNFPPGPIGFPIFGITPYIGGRPEKTFNEWRSKYGDIIGFKMGKDLTVVLNSYELIHEALVKKGAFFSHRPDNFIMTDVMHKSGISMSDYTKTYVKERKFAFISFGKVGLGTDRLESAILEQAQSLTEQISETDGRLGPKIKRSLMNAAGNTVCQFLLGRTYHHDDPEFIEIAEAFVQFFSEGSLAYKMTMILPWIHHLPPIRYSANAIRKGFKTIDRIMTQKIDEHEKTLDETNLRDFIDEYLVEMKTNGNPEIGLYSKKMLNCMGRDLFGGGMNTVQVTLLYLCIILANRPHIQEKMHDEIDGVIGDDGIPRYALKEKMPYCQAVLREILRYRTAGPLALAHCTSEDVVCGGYNIPKGTTILPNLYAVHNDPNLWENPHEFMPERHLDAKGRLNVSKYLIPFGLGPRTCIGRKLAEMELFIFSISILRMFKIITLTKIGCARPFVVEDAKRTGMTIEAPDDSPIILVQR